MSSRLEILQKMLAENPTDAFLQFALAKEWESLGQNSCAIEQFELLRRQHPDYVGLYYHLGKLYEKSGQPTLAMEVFDAGWAVARSQNDLHAAQELAAARLELSDF